MLLAMPAAVSRSAKRSGGLRAGLAGIGEDGHAS